MYYLNTIPVLYNSGNLYRDKNTFKFFVSKYTNFSFLAKCNPQLLDVKLSYKY